MKKILKKSTLVLIIAALLLSLLSLLVSCQTGNTTNGNKKDESDADGANAKQADNQNAEDQEEAEERIYPDLPAKDFGGYEFTFLSRTIDNVDWVEWNHRDLTAEEENGDVINDAVFLRNSKIGEKYNITFNEIVVENPQLVSLTQKSVKAGDDSYDVVAPHIMELATLSQGGNLMNLFSVPNMDLSQQWWDQGTIRDLSIINKLFILQGDLLVIDNDAMEAMIFNKAVLRDNALDDPYVIVKNGEWTLDKLIEMSKGIAQDLNGDGEMYIKDDKFGCIVQADTNISFFVSGGEKVCSKDENDYPVITFGSERGYNILEKVSELMLDENNVVHLHRYEGQFGIYDEQVKMMEENRALFSWIRMRIVERLRGMEMDFGILPLPKLDKNQDKYITHMNPHTGAGISIPITAGDIERTGMILEDLCAESRYTLRPAYYERNLKGKYTRDDESYEMLDIILSNTAHDIGYVYDFGGFAGTTLIRNGQNKKSDYASPFEKAQGKMEKDIQKFVAAYEKIGQ